MPVEFKTYEWHYKRRGKYIFVPSDLGARIGTDLKAKVESAYVFDDFVFHLKRKGGHVAALHAHREHAYFARVDIRRFFYSISRHRVRRALSEIAIDRALHYAKWSCVKNPYEGPSYVLPYGFIQSPILATLVLMESGVGPFLRALAAAGIVLPTVYMDDISLSSNDLSALQSAFDHLRIRLQEAEFEFSVEKTREPGPAMDLFNCDLSCGQTAVRPERIDLFLSKGPSDNSAMAFDRYCASVEEGNV